MEGPDDVLALMDTGAEGVVALVRDAGATFLAPIYHELTGDHLHERHAAQPHRDRQPRVPGAVRDGLPRSPATSPPRAPRSSSTAPATRRSSVADAETAGRDRQPAHRLPRADLPGAHQRAHLARERADPGHRLHRGGLRRDLPALPRDDGAHRRGHAGRGDRPPGSPPGVPGRPLLPVVDRQLLPARPQDHGDGRPGGRRPCPHGHGPRLLGAGRPRLPRRRHPPGVGHRDVAHLRRRHRRRAARRRGADRRRRAPRRGQAVQRHARQPPLPALLRHPRRLRRHRPVPGARRSPGARCSSATSTGSPTATSRGPTSPRTCRTTTSPPRSCSRTCRAPSPTSARRTTRPRTTSTASSRFGLYTTDGLPPGELRPVPGRRARRHRRRRAQGAGPALPQHRRHGARREDPRRRLRVLHVPPPVRRGRRASPTSSTGRVPRDLPEPLYQLLSAMQGENASIPEDVPYYDLYPEEAPA